MLKGSFPRGSPPGHGLGGCDRRAGGLADPQQKLSVGGGVTSDTHQLTGGLLAASQCDTLWALDMEGNMTQMKTRGSLARRRTAG